MAPSLRCPDRCAGVGDSAVAAVAASCPALRHLNLACCARPTDGGLALLGQLDDFHYQSMCFQ